MGDKKKLRTAQYKSAQMTKTIKELCDEIMQSCAKAAQEDWEKKKSKDKKNRHSENIPHISEGMGNREPDEKDSN